MLAANLIIIEYSVPTTFFSFGDFGGATPKFSIWTADYGLSGSRRPTDKEKMPTPTEIFLSIDEKALLRKIDFRVIPVLFIIYVASFLDR